MDCIELDVEVIVADEAFDIHPPHPAALHDEHVDAARMAAYRASLPSHVVAAEIHARRINHEAHVNAWADHRLFGDIPL